MIVSVDFDNTLSKESVQKYINRLLNNGIEVWITTRRFETLDKYNKAFCIAYNITNLEEQHAYLFVVAEELGIPREHIIFTNMQDKADFIKDKGFIWHLDDDRIELDDINSRTDVIGISVHGNYRHKCNKLIKNYEKS